MAVRPPADLVDADPPGRLVQRHRRGDRRQRLSQALAAQQLRLVAGVRGELPAQPGPALGEERLVAVEQELPQPGPDPRRLGQQPLAEAQLPRPARRGQLQGAAAQHGVGQRAGAGGVAGQGAGELQRGGHELLVGQLVEQVQVRGQGPARQRGAARQARARQEQIGERRPPQELGLAHPVGQVRVEPCGHARHPALQAGVVARLGQGVQRHAELGQWRGRHGDPLRAQPRDVDGDAHGPMVHGVTGTPAVD